MFLRVAEAEIPESLWREPPLTSSTRAPQEVGTREVQHRFFQRKQRGFRWPNAQHYFYIDLFNGCIYFFNSVVLRRCSINRLGNTLQTDLQNPQYSSRKAQLPDKSLFKRSCKQDKETCFGFCGEMLHQSNVKNE